MNDTQAKKDRELLDKVHRLCGDADLEDVCTDGDLPIPTLDEIIAAAKREAVREYVGKEQVDESYCDTCGTCGYIGCCGVVDFLDNHVKGKTNCLHEESMIEEIKAYCEDI